MRAVDQVKLALQASQRMGIGAMATFSGALAWPFCYPWPQRPAGLIDTAFEELARRWTPILDVAEENGVDVCYEIHPGEDTLRRHHLRDVPRQGEGAQAGQHAL